MSGYRDAKCRLCRREGMKLFLKGDRCNTPKCALERRENPPGEPSKRFRRKPSSYSLHLREKQKVRRIYGIGERQFKSYFKRAERKAGVSSGNLLIFLERRLDNVVFRLGFTPSRSSARQLVRHGHFLVNGKKVDIPSYLIRPGDVIKLKDTSRSLVIVEESLGRSEAKSIPRWLSLDRGKFTGEVLTYPTREEITFPIEERMIVEFYSK